MIQISIEIKNVYRLYKMRHLCYNIYVLQENPPCTIDDSGMEIEKDMPIGKEPIIPPKENRLSSPAPPLQQKTVQWNTILPNYTMDDLILDELTRTQILDVIAYFENHDLLFKQWGLEQRFSSQDRLTVNLYGPPGTGKTLAAHAISAALHLPMICVDYAEIESKYVGETSKNLSRLFQSAKSQNAAIFFDEADALLSKRVINMTSATDVSVNQTRSVLLNLLNDYHGVILFATNFIQNFDPAFLRRIKYHIQFRLPDAEFREKLWRMYIPHELPCSVNYIELAEKYDNISGSDIANAVFSAALRAAREKEPFVSQSRFEEAIQSCINVKNANKGAGITVSKRLISEEEVKEKLGTEVLG